MSIFLGVQDKYLAFQMNFNTFFRGYPSNSVFNQISANQNLSSYMNFFRDTRKINKDS